MKTGESLKLTTPGERDLVMTRVFDAPRKLVFDAHTRPELVRRWLLGPPGWSMPVCEIDLRVGGTFRYVWQHDRDGTKMAMGGVYREIKAPERIVNTEKFDEAWYPGEALGTLVLMEQGGKTTLTYTMRYESRAARDAVIKSNMESGVAASYDRLAELLASTPTRCCISSRSIRRGVSRWPARSSCWPRPIASSTRCWAATSRRGSPRTHR